MRDTTYNGWTNYETWVVNLWLGNDFGNYNYMQALATDYLQDSYDKGCDADSALNDASYELAQTLRSDVEDTIPDSLPGMLADLLRGALHEVNWYEIALHYVNGAAQTLEQEARYE